MKSSFYISLGVWVALLPFLGFPGFWRDILVTLSGIFLALTSLGPIILKKLQNKSKVVRRKKVVKEVLTVDGSENNTPTDAGKLG